MFIQALLIAAALGLLLVLLRSRTAARTRAWSRLLMVGLVLVAIVTVLEPDITTRVAHLVGVGRGTDLLLYLLTTAFLYVVVSVYLKFRDIDMRLTKVLRRMAVTEALNDGPMWPEVK